MGSLLPPEDFRELVRSIGALHQKQQTKHEVLDLARGVLRDHVDLYQRFEHLIDQTAVA